MQSVKKARRVSVKHIELLAVWLCVVLVNPCAYAKVVYSNDFEAGSASLSEFTIEGKGSYSVEVDSGELRIDTHTPTPCRGSAVIHTSKFLSPYTSRLRENPGVVSWSFDVANEDGQFNNGFFFTLASNAINSNIYTTTLYKFGGGGYVGNRMVLYRNSPSTSLTYIIDIENGLRTLPSRGSIRITYDPSTERWSLYMNGRLLGSNVDNEFTGLDLPYVDLGGHTTGSDYFDNMVVEVDVRGPVIGITPHEFNLSCPVGGPNPDLQSLSIWNEDIGTLNWEISEDCDWLEVWPTLGQSSGEVNEIIVSVDGNGLDVGEYSCVLTVSDSNAINTPQHITVNLDVRRPIIGVTPGEFNLSCPVGGPNPDPQSLSIWNEDIGTLNWEISEDCDWLEVWPTLGQSSGEVNKVVVSVDGSGLDVGEYSCVLTVSDSNAINTPKYITVNLDVRRPVIGVTPGEFNLSCPVGGPNPEPQSLMIWNEDIGTLNWEIIENCGWLHVQPISGQSSGDVNEVVISIDSNGLNAGDFSCVLTISDQNATNQPQYITVNLEMRTPVIGVMPSQVDFFYLVGEQNPDPQSLSIWNEDIGTLNWEISEDCDWLDVWPTLGHSAGEVNEVVVEVDGAGLDSGEYSCMLTVSDDSASNSPIAIGVTLIVHLAVELHVPGEFPTIQSAINAAYHGDTVIVATGTYTGDGNRDLDFLGKAITVRSMYPDDANIVAATIIDCNGSPTEPHRGFDFHSGEDANSILDGFTVVNGYSEDGGGISCTHNNPTIRNCVITRNQASMQGGGMYNYGSRPIVSNCMFSMNSAGWLGGGMGNYRSSPQVVDCVFVENSAGTDGGGIGDSGGPIINCTFTGNRAGDDGGGLKHCSGSVIGCTINGNSAGGMGGGLYKCSALVANCVITGNVAGADGGGLFSYKNYSYQSMTNCVITGNWAVGDGGGLFNYRNYVYGSIANCTIANNAAGDDAGGMYNRDCNPVLTNCILWGNVDSSGIGELAQISGSGTAVLDYSCVQGLTGGGDGTSNIDADPCFVELGYWADVNDPNIVVEPNDANAVWAEGNYSLAVDSPCVDAGDNGSVPEDFPDLDGDGNTAELLPFDLDGGPRIADGDGDGNSVVDMGAYEYFVPPVEVSMKFTPGAVNPGSNGKWVKGHLVLPEGYEVGDVDGNSPAVLEPGGVESDHVNVFVNEDGVVEVVAAFDRRAFCAAGISGEAIEVTVTGSFVDGGQFYGTDTVRITSNYMKQLAGLASRWLEGDCGKPDWCGGLDINQDSVVNLVDFALLDGCCFEVVGE